MNFTNKLELSFLSSLPTIGLLVFAILIIFTVLIILYFSKKIKKTLFILWIKALLIIFLVVSFGLIMANFFIPPNKLLNEQASLLFIECIYM